MYRQSDIDIIKKSIDKIKDEAESQKLNTLEPTITEFREVYSVILDFLKKTKKKIYGGYAQNHLIKIKNEHDTFYRDLDLADIEFYSYEPVKDMIELCDLLYSKKFKNIQGAEGVHPGTFKVFVNFINYCDISYMPKNVYDNLPIIEDKGILYTHPHFMLVDALRVYADPLTSYFRLDKTFNRFSKLIKYYPFDNKFITMTPDYNTNINKDELLKIKRTVRHEILHNSELIVIGHYAYNYLVKKVDPKLVVDCPYYQAISINYNEDKVKITNFIKKKIDNITTKEFVPYFQFYDKHTEYYYKGVCIFKLYGHNNRCIVNQFSEKKKVFFGTFQLIFLYLLCDYQYAITRRESKEQTNYMILITRIIKAKYAYLDSHDKTVLDNTPFQEFTLKCFGKTEDPLRSARLESKKRKAANKQIVFRYDPKGTPGKVPIINFENSSGNEIMKK